VTLARRLAAETLGSALLLATVVGSGIMAERLAGGNDALALLANAIATGCMLFVLIAALGPISGAHFNPAVTLSLALRREVTLTDAALYLPAQIAGAILGVILAHAMFDLSLLQESTTARTGSDQWIAEAVATFGLLFTIYGTRHTPALVAPAVALFITAAYWFTASTSFANPAVTLARALTDTFAGIAPQDAPAFIAVQLATALLATPALAWLFASDSRPLSAR
jgi:glycerol uptake facilitator-like aquaporin